MTPQETIDLLHILNQMVINENTAPTVKDAAKDLQLKILANFTKSL